MVPWLSVEGTSAVILGIDCGIGSFGWAKVEERTALVESLGVLMQEPDKSPPVALDRSRRLLCQAELVDSLCTDVTAVVHEEASYNPRIFAQNVDLASCIGMVVTYAWAAGIPVYQMPPKRWQHAIAGTKQPAKVDYNDVSCRVERRIECCGQALLALCDIKPHHRNHAIDAAGIALCFAIDPTLATRVR